MTQIISIIHNELINYYEYYGFTWNIRLIGFGLGTLVFGVMSWSLLDEIPTLKTIICLMLAASIVLIQVTNVIGE